MKSALVTGSSGFIGSHLVEALKKKDYKVLEFDIKNGNDLRNTREVENFIKKTDVVFNLGGILGTSELVEGSEARKAVEINILGTLNVLETARKYKKKVVEIGKPNIWLNTYSITKQAAENFTLMYVKEHGLKAWIIRWFDVYGPRQHYGVPQKLAPTTIVRALKNKDIPVFGNGKQFVDYIYVKDAVGAAIKIYETPKAMGIPVEVGSGTGMTVNDFTRAVKKITKSKSKIKYLPMRKGQEPTTSIVANTEYLFKQVRFIPKWSLDAGLKEAVEYYRENLSKF